ncbi:MAG: hypothetical protein FWE82_03725, partial [Defluviitaleaceae bacterium]|nr:hypothetical protein [Defluviitaleaceae bacterium]
MQRECTTWSRLLCVVSEFMYEKDEALFENTIKDNIWFNKEKGRLYKPIQILESPWYSCGGGFGGTQVKNIATRLIEKMGCSESVQLEVYNPLGSELKK